MAKLSLLAGTTSKTVKVFIQNNSVTTGAGLTGLAFNTASLVAYYIREGDSSVTTINLVTATLGTFTSSGFIVVDGTKTPGMYEIGIPNAALAAGSKSVIIYLNGAANMAPVVLEIELTAVDNQNANYGLTNLDATISSRMATYTQPTGFLAATFPTGTVANTTNITAGTITTATNLTNAPTAGDLTAAMKTSVTTAATAATPTAAAVTGAVGSVTGAVGSVTAAVTVSGTSALTEAYPAKNGALTLASALYSIHQNLWERGTATTTLTVKKRDQSTTAKTGTFDSSTAPTSLTEAS